MELLHHYNINVSGKHAVVVGRSNIVGKPMIQCMLNKNATVTVCHSKTKNLLQITKQALHFRLELTYLFIFCLTFYYL